MEIATKESILSLLNSTDSDDVKLGIIVLLRQAENQKEVADFIEMQFRSSNSKAGNEICTREFSYWKCKDKWIFINSTQLIASSHYSAPEIFRYDGIKPHSNDPVIHDVYDPE